MKIEELGLSVRPYHVLKRNGINTVEQLQQLSDEDLMLFRSMGRHSLAEIREKLAFVKTMTNGDRLRSMSDEQLASFLYGLIDLDSKIHYCKNKPECDGLLDTEDGIPVEMCTGCLCEWLRQPAEEDFP